jgi:hypothetical protein
MYPPQVNRVEQFDVTVCEAVIQPDTSYSLGTMNLAAVNLNPTNIQVYGDSGCESSTSECSDTSTASFYFNELVGNDAAQSIDLLLHMGDYNYRGTTGLGIDEYDAGDGTDDEQCQYDSTYVSQNAQGTYSSESAHPDGWQYWQSDFFVPAQPLSAKAPWLFARGNHELCSRAGPGWFYFLGPGSSLSGGVAQQQCPDQGSVDAPPVNAHDSIVMIDPYLVKLTNMQIWAVDSANNCGFGVAFTPGNLETNLCESGRLLL